MQCNLQGTTTAAVVGRSVGTIREKRIYFSIVKKFRLYTHEIMAYSKCTGL